MHEKSTTMTDEEFSAVFPVTKNEALVAMTGTSLRTLIRRARRLGLQKSADFLREIQSGANNYGWKGGRPLRDARFLDPAYAAWRKRVLERDGYRCRRCERHSRTGRGLHAHHRESWIAAPHLRYSLENGETYCFVCHLYVHGKTPRTLLPSHRPCACGCGTLVATTDHHGYQRRYVSGHNWRGKKRPAFSSEHRAALGVAHSGKRLSGEQKAKISAGNKGRVKSAEEIAKQKASRAGYRHSAEVRATISAMQRGKPRAARLLTADHIRAIRARTAAGERQGDLAVEYGISRSTVSKIVLGHTWKEVF